MNVYMLKNGLKYQPFENEPFMNEYEPLSLTDFAADTFAMAKYSERRRLQR